MTRVNAVALGVWIASMLIVSSAWAQTKAECVAAHEETQSLSQQTKLLAAREQATLCSSEACPSVLQRECVALLAKVQAEIPSVALRMRDAAGNDLVDVTVVVDGTAIKESLDGKPVELDPGSHTFVFQPKDGEPVERLVVVVAGQRNQLVEVRVENRPDPAPPVPPAPPATPSPAPETPPKTDIGTNYMAIGGILSAALAVSSLAAFAAVGALAMSERSELESCKPRCSDDEVDPVQTKLVVADVFLTIGVVSAAAAAVLLPIAYLGTDSSEPRATLVIGPGTLGVRGAF